MTDTTNYSRELWHLACQWQLAHPGELLETAFCEGAVHVARAVHEGQTNTIKEVLTPPEIDPVPVLQGEIGRLLEIGNKQEKELKELRWEKDDLTRKLAAANHREDALTNKVRILSTEPTNLNEMLELMQLQLNSVSTLAYLIRRDISVSALSPRPVIDKLNHLGGSTTQLVSDLRQLVTSGNTESSVQYKLRERHYVLPYKGVETTVTTDMLEQTSVDGPWSDLEAARTIAKRKSERSANIAAAGKIARYRQQIHVVWSYNPVTNSWARDVEETEQSAAPSSDKSNEGDTV